MSQHQTHGSDRAAAYRGLILGAVAIGVLLFTIVKLTHAHYAGAEGAKTGSASTRSHANGPLDA
jgi:hypothetical protein